jgi:hypothetical protein
MEDIIGKKFGVLKVLSHAYYDGKHHYYFVECNNCNQSIIVNRNNLLNRRTKSCGCLKKTNKIIKRRYKHGYSNINGKRTPVYGSWFNMKQRCLNHNNPAYKNYGGRGITVCERWMKFKNFLEDMGERPEGKTLDRIDNDGNYEPSNCKWSTPKEQANNTKKILTKTEIENRKKKYKEEIKKRKKEKIEKHLFKLNGSIIPFEYIEKTEEYKVICKCKRTFLVKKRNLRHTFNCCFCTKSKRGRRNNFIKLNMNNNLKKALDILYEKNMINNYDMPLMIIL